MQMRCDQCQALMIQGMFCHETGCPHEKSRYDEESGEWIRQRECWICGYTVDADNPCCEGEQNEPEDTDDQDGEDRETE